MTAEPRGAEAYLTCCAALKLRIARREPLFGTFVKTAAASTVEILAQSGLDFLVLDGEHAPFGTHAMDACILAARGAGMPLLVRLQDTSPAAIGAVLDQGAAGVVVPRVNAKATAQAVSAAAHYGAGGARGFSPSTRAAAYGHIPANAYRTMADEAAIVLVQIEDRDGVSAAADIAETPGIDAVLIGPVDLAVSLGAEGPGDGAVTAAIGTIAGAAKAAGRAVGIAAAGTADLRKHNAAGLSLFVLSTDQALVRGAATALARDCSAMNLESINP